jgi:hypothetical protein
LAALQQRLLTEVSSATTDFFTEELAALSNEAASDTTQPTQAQV